MSQDKKEIKKVVTGLVSVPVTFQLVARWPRLEMKEPVDYVWSMTMMLHKMRASLGFIFQDSIFVSGFRIPV